MKKVCCPHCEERYMVCLDCGGIMRAEIIHVSAGEVTWKCKCCGKMVTKKRGDE